VYDPIYLEHNLMGHPENKERLMPIMGLLEKQGVLQAAFNDLTQVRSRKPQVIHHQIAVTAVL